MKIRILLVALATLTLGTLSLGAQASLVINVDSVTSGIATVSYGGTSATPNPETCTDFDAAGLLGTCTTSDVNGGNDDALWTFLAGDNVWKEDGADNSGLSLAGSYKTDAAFIPGASNDVDIIYNPGNNFVDCSADCWLVVKDGSAQPARYLFNLALLGWDGMETIDLNNFFSGNAISHVALYGNVSPIPVPAAFWLFGTALIGFVGMSRRTRV